MTPETTNNSAKQPISISIELPELDDAELEFLAALLGVVRYFAQHTLLTDTQAKRAVEYFHQRYSS